MVFPKLVFIDMYLCWSSLVDNRSYLSTFWFLHSLYVTQFGKSVFGDQVILCDKHSDFHDK